MHKTLFSSIHPWLQRLKKQFSTSVRLVDFSRSKLEFRTWIKKFPSRAKKRDLNLNLIFALQKKRILSFFPLWIRIMQYV